MPHLPVVRRGAQLDQLSLLAKRSLVRSRRARGLDQAALVLEAFETWLVSPTRVQAIRKNIAMELGGQGRKLETELNDRRESLQHTELEIRG